MISHIKHNYKKIAFQGVEGAYSDMACRAAFPDFETVSCNSFDQAFNCVLDGRSDLAMIPVDNTIAGRVADVHHLMPHGDLFIIGEHFQPIHHMYTPTYTLFHNVEIISKSSKFSPIFMMIQPERQEKLPVLKILHMRRLLRHWRLRSIILR